MGHTTLVFHQPGLQSACLDHLFQHSIHLLVSITVMFQQSEFEYPFFC